ncbi:hypothetical protein KVP40.0022 [Vibrio phage KVP40]|uniref:Uncharacterized protein n=2 Tax=Schizotequatrovirus KVP40 TaxID=1914019 RepID=Q6WIC9_BPKVM|nr:hypothetical protein KVP40.0022 [Vibrio phage KVP40]QIW91013.1 hypothetical protein COHAPHLL_00150 [Vibrio phage V09]UNA01918.1 hypothetical protein [Vibrio phage PC-Liy1]URQ03215.1 hypothetical protein PVA8_229 [Vibrio phage PVA8]WBM58950.1 hypothetical protein vBValMPVA8_228 [Vibrio phage vB_ValM_PVA8]WOL25067.1 hypothetical protein [Vibrio phage PG216]
MHTPISRTGEILGSMRSVLMDERIEAALRMDIARDQEQKEKMLNSNRTMISDIDKQQRRIESKLDLLHSLLDVKKEIS